MRPHKDRPWFMEYAWWCSDSVCRTCPHLPRFLWRWGPPGLFPSGRTAAAPLQRRRSPGRAPHTRAAPTSACGSCSWERRGGGKQVWKKWWRIRRESCENVLQIGKNDAWNRVRGLCSIPSHPHTCRHLQEYRGVNSETDTALSLPLLFPLVLHLSPISYQIILYWGDADGAFPPLSLVDKVRIQIICLGKRQSLPVFFIVDL